MTGLVNNLFQLCEAGRLDLVKEALEAGADPNITGYGWNTTCLMVAVIKGHTGVVNLLLEHPAIKVNAKDSHGWTALHLATLFLPHSAVGIAILHKILATTGILLNEKTALGDTPIMFSARSGPIEALRMMAAMEEVDLEVLDEQGRSLEEISIHQRADRAQVVQEARQRRRWDVNNNFLISPIDLPGRIRFEEQN